MIMYTESLDLSITAAQLLCHLQSSTVQAYSPLSCGYTHSYELQSLPDFRLMEGLIVPPHTDGVAGYRPILVLHNPSNIYTIRGTSQRFSAQKRGTMVILDIDSPHEVHSKDPNCNFGPWSGLVWGQKGQPLIKSEWTVESVVTKAKAEFLALSSALQSNLSTLAAASML